ncbi:baseplate hub protein [Providencia manganoxydans]|uniref:baseplate hub protein n=1 Tax=Providencia manganoxydans TaxID=2923283 RepID=UPI0032D9C136
MAFNRKVIKITLVLGGKEESFTSDNKNKLSATGLRISAEITNGNGVPSPSARVRVYGLPIETMSKLLRIKWREVTALKNSITIEAGEQGEDLVTAFKGGITFAYPDLAEAPNVSLVVTAQTAVLENMQSTAAESYEDSQEVINIMGNICQRMGYTLEDNGVSQQLDNVYLCNSDIKKIQWLAESANLDLYVESNHIAVTNKGQPRKIKIPVITPDTGLIGYPTPTMQGIQFQCFYDPLIRFGGLVRIKDSLIDVCNGDWLIYGVRAMLETESDSARWFMDVAAYDRGDNTTYVKR